MSRNYALYRFPKESFGCYITVFIEWYFRFGRCSNTDRSHHLQSSKLNLGQLRVVEMSQRTDTGGSGANDQEERTAFKSSAQVKNLVENAVKECLAVITAGNTATVILTRVPALSSQL